MIMNAAIPIVHIYRASRPVDLRKGIDGIASIVQSLLQMDPYDTHFSYLPAAAETASRSFIAMVLVTG
nr:IS66 family insertion sequence element accessory protein TnpB [Faecalibaculum rodentium]